MEKDFDYTLVPNTFIHCIHASCVHMGDCLRYQVMQHVTPERGEILSIINLANIPNDGQGCRYFLSDKKTRFASGITHLLDNISYNKAVIIKRELYSYFGKNTFYRVRNQERLINPVEQNYIRKLFLHHEIDEEPVFDKYIEKYEWL